MWVPIELCEGCGNKTFKSSESETFSILSNHYDKIMVLRYILICSMELGMSRGDMLRISFILAKMVQNRL